MEHKVKGTEAEQKIAAEISRPWYQKVEPWLSVVNIIFLMVNIALLFSQSQIPLTQNRKDQISRDFECAKYVQENYPGYVNSDFTSTMQTEYRYSHKLNTCLAYFQMKGSYDSRSVVDLYSSQNILQYYENCEETQKSLTDGKPHKGFLAISSLTF